MKSTRYAEIVGRLAPVLSFPPEVFFEDDDAPQEVCDFFLALAVVYTDLRDLWIHRILVLDTRPEGSPAINSEWGEFGGIQSREYRLTAGMLEEFLDLLRKHRKEIESPCFLKVRSRMSREARQHWNTLVLIAQGKKQKDSLAQSIARIRNEIGYHYLPGTLGSSYRSRFKGKSGKDGPFVSSGDNLKSTRLYFADAAVEAFLMSKTGTLGLEAANNPSVLLEPVARAIYGLVNHFIHMRSQPRVWIE